MDGFTGFKSATAEELPDAAAVMDPFHVVRLAGDALDQCRRRVQQELHGHRGRKDDPLYRARRTLHTGAGLLTDKQQTRLQELFVLEEHVPVEAAWHQQWPHRGDQRTPGAPARLGPGLPQPDQLHRQIPARVRRIQTSTTPSSVKSRFRHPSSSRTTMNDVPTHL